MSYSYPYNNVDISQITMSSSNEHPYLTRAKLADIVQKAEGGSKVELLECKVTDLSCLGKNYSGEIIFCDITAKIDNENTKVTTID